MRWFALAFMVAALVKGFRRSKEKHKKNLRLEKDLQRLKGSDGGKDDAQF